MKHTSQATSNTRSNNHISAMLNKKKSVLVTGASGTVGIEVLKILSQQSNEFEITVFDIKSSKTKQKLNTFKNIEIIYGDISNNNAIRKACSNIDFVIHLAAIIPPLADDFPDCARKVNVIGTENLIRNLEELSPSAFVLYSSSVSVYGDRLENPYIQTTDPLIPSEGDEYARTKVEAENTIINSKLNWSIFRISAIMGRHKISKLLFHMPLNTSLEIITPVDTAKAFVNALNKKELISKKIFNLGGGRECQTTYKYFLIRSFKILGLGKLNFPKHAFAEKNFHCGYYQDGDKLEEILHFRSNSIEDYFNSIRNTTPIIKYIFTFIFQKPIKTLLLMKSEPYKAYSENNISLKDHFFIDNIATKK